MRKRIFGCAALAAWLACAQAPTGRVANTTLALPSQAPAPGAWTWSTASNAFPGLTFSTPIFIAAPPGETNRLFIVERAGTIQVITNLAAPTKTAFMSISSRVSTSGEGGLLGLAFHPGFASNRQFFVYYTAPAAGGFVLSNRISRFTTLLTDGNRGDTNSEVAFIGQPDQQDNHNGGTIAFGNDGYLYFAAGDEGGGGDNWLNSQTINRDFFSGMLRIDVDKKPGSLPPNHHQAIVAPTNYAIPPDNPFVGVTNFAGTNIAASSVRTEFFAIGLRNPFRWSFDRLTGRIWLADVGQGLYEEVDIVTNGGNYGWNRREGFHQYAGTNGASLYADPILEYAHGSATNQGNSITGGIVYRGDLFPDLYGRYLFADYVSGHVWSMAWNGTNVTAWDWLATDGGIAAFAEDPRNGEVLICDLGANYIKRLTRVPAVPATIPPTLAQTGIFTNTATLAPAPGVVPFDVNTPLWSDGAGKRRWFCLPSTNLFAGFDPHLPWSTPTGAVWVKHFDLLLTNGDAASARRLETRVLVRNADGAGGYGVTYRWGTSLTNAALVQAAGLDEPFVIHDGGTIRTQVWHYPSRSECLVCHQSGAGFVLGFTTAQLNRDLDYGGETTNQLRALARAGYFATNPAAFHPLPALAAITNQAWSEAWRVRSYLQANCANCHFPGGPTPADFDARIVPALSQAGLLDGPLDNTFGDPANRVVAPGDTGHSMLLTRMATRGANQMPPLGSHLADTQAVALVTAWIQSLAGHQTFAQWQMAQFGSTNGPGTGAGEDFDADGAVNELEYLTGTQPTNAPDAWGISSFLVDEDGTPHLGWLRVANRGFDLQGTTNLMDPFSWVSLDEPGNAPYFAATNAPATTALVATNAPERFLRFRVYEP